MSSSVRPVAGRDSLCSVCCLSTGPGLRAMRPAVFDFFLIKSHYTAGERAEGGWVEVTTSNCSCSPIHHILAI